MNIQGVVALIDKQTETINDNIDNNDEEFLYIPSDKIDTIFQNKNIPVFLEHCVAYKVGDTQKFYVKQTLINKILRDVVMCDFVINNTDFIDVLRESMLRVHDIMNNHDETKAKIMSSDNFINSTHVKKYMNKDVFTTSKGMDITAKKTLLSTFPALSLGHSVPDKKAIELSLVLAGKRPNTIITSVRYCPPKNTELKVKGDENGIQTQKPDFWKILGSLLSKKNFNRVAKVRQDQKAIELPNEEFSMDDNNDAKIDFIVNPSKVSSIRKEIIQHGNTELLKNNITTKILPITKENSATAMEVVRTNPMIEHPQAITTSNSSQQQQQQYQLPGGITITYSQSHPKDQQQYPGYFVNPYVIPQINTGTSNNDEIKKSRPKKSKRKLSYSDDDTDDNDDNPPQWKRLNNTLKNLTKVLEYHEQKTTKTPQVQTHPVQLPGQYPQSAQQPPLIIYDGVSYIPKMHSNSNTGTSISAQKINKDYKNPEHIPPVIINFGDELKHILGKADKPQNADIESGNTQVPETSVKKEETNAEELNKTEVSKTQTFSLPNSLQEAFNQKVNSDSYCFITKQK